MGSVLSTHLSSWAPPTQLAGGVLAKCPRRTAGELGNPFLQEICKVGERNQHPGWLTPSWTCLKVRTGRFSPQRFGLHHHLPTRPTVTCRKACLLILGTVSDTQVSKRVCRMTDLDPSTSGGVTLMGLASRHSLRREASASPSANRLTCGGLFQTCLSHTPSDPIS